MCCNIYIDIRNYIQRLGYPHTDTDVSEFYGNYLSYFTIYESVEPFIEIPLGKNLQVSQYFVTPDRLLTPPLPRKNNSP